MPPSPAAAGRASAARSGRFILSRQAKTIYTAELLEANKSSWKYGVTEDDVREAFSLIDTGVAHQRQLMARGKKRVSYRKECLL